MYIEKHDWDPHLGHLRNHLTHVYFKVVAENL